MADWRVSLHAHHEEYISWEELLKNLERLEKKRTNGEEMVLRRDEKAWPYSRDYLICGHCGRALTVRYTGNVASIPATGRAGSAVFAALAGGRREHHNQTSLTYRTRVSRKFWLCCASTYRPCSQAPAPAQGETTNFSINNLPAVLRPFPAGRSV